MAKFRINSHDHTGENPHVLVIFDGDDAPLKLYFHEIDELFGNSDAMCEAFEIEPSDFQIELYHFNCRLAHRIMEGVA